MKVLVTDGLEAEALARLKAKHDVDVIEASPSQLLDIIGRYDAVIVSTLAPGVSRWLQQGLPGRIQRMLEVPVIHVTAERDNLRDPFVRLTDEPQLAMSARAK